MKKWLNASQKLKNFWWRWVVFTVIITVYVAILPLLVSGGWQQYATVTVTDALEVVFAIAVAAILPALLR